MSQPTAPIPAIVKHTIIDAIAEALHPLRKAADAETLGRHIDPAHPRHAATLVKAKANLDWLNWVHDLVLHDQHDSTMHLRLGGVIVALEDLHDDGVGFAGTANAGAARLRVAALLLQQARRAATMDAVIRDIRSAAIDISAKAAELCDDAIARSIEAQANRIAQQARR